MGEYVEVIKDDRSWLVQFSQDVYMGFKPVLLAFFSPIKHGLANGCRQLKCTAVLC